MYVLYQRLVPNPRMYSAVVVKEPTLGKGGQLAIQLRVPHVPIYRVRELHTFLAPCVHIRIMHPVIATLHKLHVFTIQDKHRSERCPLD